MKKLTPFLALVLALTPVATMADSAQSTTVTGNTINQGAVSAYNLNPTFPDPGSPTIGFVVGQSTGPLVNMIHTDQSFNALLQNPGLNTTGDAKTSIRGFSISCLPYNPAFVGLFNYPYGAEINGVGGGTVTIHEYKKVGAVVIVGTVVLPSSPHNGPYINYAKSMLAAPYVPTAGSVFDAQVTFADPATAQSYQSCVVTSILQEAIRQPGS